MQHFTFKSVKSKEHDNLRKLFLLLILFTSCGPGRTQNASDLVVRVHALPSPTVVPFRDKELWGFSDTSGRLIIPAQFREAKLIGTSLLIGVRHVHDQKTYLYTKGGLLLAVYDDETEIQPDRLTYRQDSRKKLFLFSNQRQDTVLYNGKLTRVTYPAHHIYTYTGSFRFDSGAYWRQFTSRSERFAIIGKKEGYSLRWGLLDSSGILLEPMVYVGLFPFGDTYVRVKDSGGTLYGGFPGNPYYKWPFKSIEAISGYEQIAEGFFIVKNETKNTISLFRYDGKVVTEVPGRERISFITGFGFSGEPKYFRHAATVLGKQYFGIIDGDGNTILPPLYNEIFRATPTVFLVNKSAFPNYNYNAVFDAAAHRFLLDSASGYSNIALLDSSFLSLTLKGVSVLYNLKTQRQIPMAGQQAIRTYRGLFLYDSVTHEIRDPSTSNKQAVIADSWEMRFVRTGKKPRLGAFNLDRWKEVAPNEYKSIRFEQHERSRTSHTAIAIASNSESNSVYTGTGRRVYSGTNKVRVAANYAPYLIIEDGDTAHIVDTAGRGIASVVKGNSYNFTRSGAVFVVYDQHSIVIRPGKPQTMLPGAVYTKYNPDGGAQSFLKIIRAGKLGLFSTETFELVVAFDLPASRYDIIYRGMAGLFEVRENYEGDSWKLKGYIDGRGFKYWRD